MVLTKEQAKEQLRVLIDEFNSNPKKEHLTEQETRVFILKMFEVLGWSFTKGEVSQEETISKGRVDYSFRIDGVPKMFLEAKKTSNDLTDENDAQQANSYALCKATTWAVLTNFKRVRVFNAEIEGSLREARVLDIYIENYLDLFDKLWMLSREGFEQGLLDKYAEEFCKKATKRTIEARLFADLTSWRDHLAKDIKNNYEKEYNSDTVDEIIQTLLNRFILIRKIEDIGLEGRKLMEAYNTWKDSNKHLWHLIKPVFEYYDENYDSKIFDRQKNELDRIEIGDYPLKIIIPQLYTSADKTVAYDFSLIPADVLGNIYEQYLGNILKTTEKRAKMTNGAVHRKEQGVYYTPTHIVDYIIKNTLGERLKECKKPEDVEKIKVLDPASGSGSFLIRAFDEIYAWYDKNGFADKTIISGNSHKGFETVKDRILTSNLFGVDLDSKAVEIAQLNLLLKTADKKHRLPQLKENIKHGNSLIDDKNFDKYAFDWKSEFKSTMDSGGFDIVVGNPPYVNMQTLPELQKWCELKYPEIYTGQNDILYYFVLRGLDVLKNGGRLGFIVSRYFLESSYASKFRNFILENSRVDTIIDFNNFQVFGKDVNVLTAIILLVKDNKTERKRNIIKVIKIKDWDKGGLELIMHILKNKEKNVYSDAYIDIFGISQNGLTEGNWSLSNHKITEIKKKIEKNSQPLGDICDIGKGMETGLNDAFVIDTKTAIDEGIEQEILRNYIKTRDLKRYAPLNRNLKIIYIPEKVDEKSIKNALIHLEKWQTELKQRFDYKNKHCEWYSWGNLRNRELFEKNSEKIITPLYSTSNKFVYDSGKSNQNYYTLTDTYIIVPREQSKINLKYVLAMLNSKLIEFYFKNTAKLKREGYFEYAGGALSKIPIRYDKDFAEGIMVLVDKMLDRSKHLNELGDRQTNECQEVEDDIKKTDSKIDELIYKLYGITDEEKKVIEESLK